MRSPASISAVTISPRPWSQPCSTTPSPTSAVGSAYEPGHGERQRLRMLPVGVVSRSSPAATPSFSNAWTTGWISVMKNTPPGARKWATTCAQARMSGSQPRTPRDV